MIKKNIFLLILVINYPVFFAFSAQKKDQKKEHWPELNKFIAKHKSSKNKQAGTVWDSVILEPKAPKKVCSYCTNFVSEDLDSEFIDLEATGKENQDVTEINLSELSQFEKHIRYIKSLIAQDKLFLAYDDLEILSDTKIHGEQFYLNKVDCLSIVSALKLIIAHKILGLAFEGDKNAIDFMKKEYPLIPFI